MKTQNFSSCYLIAEIGVNHGGSVALARQMIDAAASSGADAVKFQTFTAEALVSKGTPKVKYQESTTDIKESHFDMIKSLEFSREDHLPVIEYCRSIGVDFISTPYDVDSAVFLDKLGVSIFKTASADIVDLPLHHFLASTGKKVIISTGMATLGEIEQVLTIYRSCNNSNLVLLHCVSNYPCAYESLDLKAMQTLAQAFQLPVGYSDHAVGPYPAVVAVALGASVIEKHFTLDKSMKGPDHKASNTPDEFRELVDAVRIAENSLGSAQKTVQIEEMQMRQVSRKSLFVDRDIAQGEMINECDLVLKRPGTGIYANMTTEIVGKKASRALIKGAMLQFGDFTQ